MIEETAMVERVEGDYIWVSPASSGGACGGCKSSGSCSTSFLVKALQGNTKKLIKVENTTQAKQGDTVVLGMQSHGLLIGSALVYLLPILGLFAFAVIGQQLFGEVGSIVLGLGGMAVSFVTIRWLIKNAKMTPLFQQIIVVE